MDKYLNKYIKEIDNILDSDKDVDYLKLKETQLEHISIFQHERIVHLIVTLFFALFTILFFTMINNNILILVIVAILLVVDIFYIIHYYKLENGTQYLYKQYERILDKLKEKDND